MPPFLTTTNGSTVGTIQNMSAPITINARNHSSSDNYEEQQDSSARDLRASFETALRLVAELQATIREKNAYISTLEHRLVERPALLRHSSSGLTSSISGSSTNILISQEIMEDLDRETALLAQKQQPRTHQTSNNSSMIKSITRRGGEDDEDGFDDESVASLPSLPHRSPAATTNHKTIARKETDESTNSFPSPSSASTMPRKNVTRTATPATGQMSAMRTTVMQKLNEGVIIEEDEQGSITAPFPSSSTAPPRKTITRTATPATGQMSAMRITAGMMQNLTEDAIMEDDDDDDDDEDDSFIVPLPSPSSASTVPRKKIIRTATPAMGKMSAMRTTGMQNLNEDVAIEEEADEDENLTPLPPRPFSVSMSGPCRPPRRTATPSVNQMKALRMNNSNRFRSCKDESSFIEEADEDEGEDEGDHSYLSTRLSRTRMPRGEVQCDDASPVLSFMAQPRPSPRNGTQSQRHQRQMLWRNPSPGELPPAALPQYEPSDASQRCLTHHETPGDPPAAPLQVDASSDTSRRHLTRYETPGELPVAPLRSSESIGSRDQEKIHGIDGNNCAPARRIASQHSHYEVSGREVEIDKTTFEVSLLRRPDLYDDDAQPAPMAPRRKETLTVSVPAPAAALEENKVTSFNSSRHKATDHFDKEAILPAPVESTPQARPKRNKSASSQSEIVFDVPDSPMTKTVVSPSFAVRPPATPQSSKKQRSARVIVFQPPRTNSGSSSSINNDSSNKSISKDPPDVVIPTKKSKARRKHTGKTGSAGGDDICFDPANYDDDTRTTATFSTEVRNELRASLNQSGSHVRDLPRERELDSD